MKGLSLLLFTMVLAGCGQKETNGQSLNSEVVKEDQLKFSRKATKSFLPNPSSAKFRNQVGDCGEVRYKDENDRYTPFQRFVVIEENIVLIENQMDPKKFELSWKAGCENGWDE